MHVPAHLLYNICSGSGSVSLHTEPDPAFIIRIRIHGSGSTSLFLIKGFISRDTCGWATHQRSKLKASLLWLMVLLWPLCMTTWRRKTSWRGRISWMTMRSSWRRTPQKDKSNLIRRMLRRPSGISTIIFWYFIVVSAAHASENSGSVFRDVIDFKLKLGTKWSLATFFRPCYAHMLLASTFFSWVVTLSLYLFRAQYSNFLNSLETRYNVPRTTVQEILGEMTALTASSQKFCLSTLAAKLGRTIIW